MPPLLRWRAIALSPRGATLNYLDYVSAFALGNEARHSLYPSSERADVTTPHLGSLSLRPVILLPLASPEFVEWLQLLELPLIASLPATWMNGEFLGQVSHLQALGPPRRTFPNKASNDNCSQCLPFHQFTLNITTLFPSKIRTMTKKFLSSTHLY